MEKTWPLSTGEVVRMLNVPEHRLISQVRLGKVTPPLCLGRRAWGAEHVIAVAKLLGRDTLEVRRECEVVLLSEVEVTHA